MERLDNIANISRAAKQQQVDITSRYTSLVNPQHACTREL